jgi:hypothetical protein
MNKARRAAPERRSLFDFMLLPPFNELDKPALFISRVPHGGRPE